ncbi:cyclodeaminase/cyclohydrolase family protein [Oscillospiraceae bacterium OttesenSCG-928-F05]|nr:cyclodeaminase/cyclohydrolase family protein [Oscillospiraceae bacterium OttesenSCG-928-F05]
MKLTDMTLAAFSEVLASDAPAPGGGSTAALTGALGAALTHMVAALTAGKKKYAEHEALTEEILRETAALRIRFLETIDKDTEAFGDVSAVFTMPKDTDEEKAARAEAMQRALKGATLPPFTMMTLALSALELTERAVGRSNQNAASDLGVAALCLKAAVQGAWLNILINLGGIRDESFKEKYRAEGEEILSKALPLADRIYNTVLQGL